MVNKRVQNVVLEWNLKNNGMTSVRFQGQPFNITVIQVYAPTRNAEEAKAEQFYEDLQDLPIPKKDVLFIIGNCNAKVGSQDIPAVTGKFGLGVQNEPGKSLIEFCQENTLVKQTPSSNNTRENSTHGHHHTINTKIRLIILFAVKEGETLYSPQNKTGS